MPQRKQREKCRRVAKTVDTSEMQQESINKKCPGRAHDTGFTCVITLRCATHRAAEDSVLLRSASQRRTSVLGDVT
jgi:hypothetical protein